MSGNSEPVVFMAHEARRGLVRIRNDSRVPLQESKTKEKRLPSREESLRRYKALSAYDALTTTYRGTPFMIYPCLAGPHANVEIDVMAGRTI